MQTCCYLRADVLLPSCLLHFPVERAYIWYTYIVLVCPDLSSVRCPEWFETVLLVCSVRCLTCSYQSAPLVFHAIASLVLLFQKWNSAVCTIYFFRSRVGIHSLREQRNGIIDTDVYGWRKETNGVFVNYSLQFGLRHGLQKIILTVTFCYKIFIKYIYFYETIYRDESTYITFIFSNSTQKNLFVVKV
jgi:hypothetical protein